MASYHEWYYNRRLREAQAMKDRVKAGFFDRYSAEFSRRLSEATSALTGGFDQYFEQDTQSRNEFIAGLQTDIEASNLAIGEIQESEQQLVQAIRSGQATRGNIATRSETAAMRKALSALRRGSELQLDEEVTKVVDLLGNEVALEDLDLGQRTSNRFTPEGPTELETQPLDEAYAEYQEMIANDAPGQVRVLSEYGQLVQRFGDRDPETMSRLVALYGDTDIALSGINDADLQEFFFDPEGEVRSSTYEQLNLALDELERDELLRRQNVARQREEQRLEKNREILAARQTFEAQASQLGQTLESLGLTSEQLQARDDLSAEGALSDTRQSVVRDTVSTTRRAPSFQQRPE